MSFLNPALEARLLVQPKAAYAALEGQAAEIRQLLGRPLRLALAIGCFISFTTTGRLSVRMVVDGFACWSFVPLANLVLVGALAYRLSRRNLAIAVDGYLAAWGPWLVWLVGISGIAVWAPPGKTEVWSLMPSPIAFIGFAIAWLWSSWIQYRCLIVLWRMPSLGAIGLLAGMKLVVWGGIALFFHLSDQLEPRMGLLLGG